VINVLIFQERPYYKFVPGGKGRSGASMAAMELVFGPGNQAPLLIAEFPLTPPPPAPFMVQSSITSQAGTKL